MRTLAEQHMPPESPELIRVLRVYPKGKLLCTIVSESHWGCWSHWCGNHTEACFCTDQEREENPRRFNHRWKAFLHIITEQGLQKFLELPRDAMNAILSQKKDRQTLRGCRLICYRVPEHARGEIHVHLDPQGSPGVTLCRAVSPRATLERLWKSKLPAGRNAS